MAKVSSDPKIRELQKHINETAGIIKRTSNPQMKELLKKELNALKAELAKYAQNQK